jgi:hypothetical protein
MFTSEVILKADEKMAIMDIAGITQVKQSQRPGRKTGTMVISSTTSPICPFLGSNTDFRVDRSGTNRPHVVKEGQALTL